MQELTCLDVAFSRNMELRLAELMRFVGCCLQVVGDKQQTSRLLLCEATAVVMRQCFDLLGMTPMYQI